MQVTSHRDTLVGFRGLGCAGAPSDRLKGQGGGHAIRVSGGGDGAFLLDLNCLDVCVGPGGGHRLDAHAVGDERVLCVCKSE